MSKVNPIHSTLLTQAARLSLRPLGLIQKGRSRIWLSDQKWWMLVVEFQPSSWSKGSYLNVGCMWLWNVKNYLSFDEGHQIEPFHPFIEADSFKISAEKLADSAAKAVQQYRALFPSIEKLSNYYLQKPPVASFWPRFNAAVAHGLAGRGENGAKLLKGQGELLDTSIAWQKAAAEDAQLVLSHIHDRERLREVISGRVSEARVLHKLTPLQHVEF